MTGAIPSGTPELAKFYIGLSFCRLSVKEGRLPAIEKPTLAIRSKAQRTTRPQFTVEQKGSRDERKGA